MKERPILFSGAMVRALLDGSKTQTRRVVNPAPLDGFPHEGSIDFDGFLPHEDVAQWSAETVGGGAFQTETRECPHGTDSDRLWVRETIFAWGLWKQRFNEKKQRQEWHFVDMTTEAGFQYRFAADEPALTAPRRRGAGCITWWKRPAIHAPRPASRITLEIVSVRVERLNDCSDADCVAEGIGLNPSAVGVPMTIPAGETLPRAAYRELWESINGAGSWAASPWVWVVAFKRVMP
jgi:hypothetical protein